MKRRSSSGRRLSRIVTFILVIVAAMCLLSVQGYGQVSADFTVDIDSGAAPLSVQFFDLSAPQDSVTSRAWDLNGDGITDSDERNPRFIYEVSGLYTVTLVVGHRTGFDTLRKAAYVDVAPVEESDIRVRIRVVDQWGPVAAAVELWGYAGSGFPMPFSPISIRIGLDSNGYATFYWAKFIPMMTQNITDLHILNAAGAVIGKTGFNYPLKGLGAHRRKDAIVIIHRDLVAYHDHLVEQSTAAGWKFPSAARFPWMPGQPALPFVQGGDPLSGPLYQTSMLIPPAAFDSAAPASARYLLDNIRPSRTPLVMLHGLGYRDGAWGSDETVLTTTDLAQPNFNGKHDYVWTSYAGRLQQLDKTSGDAFDVWQYVYPPDQSWEESGYLFARDLQILLAEYDSASSVAAAHGMGGLVLRSYLQGSARGFLSFGVPTDSAAFRGDVSRAVFLGVPHAGQLRAALAYGTAPLLPGFMDAAAPALRELTPGSVSLMKLADGSLPPQVKLLSVAGSRPTLPTPFLLQEAAQHDDYVTAVSSAMLDRPTVWNGVLAGYSSSLLRSPALDEAGNPVPDPVLIPRLLHTFLYSDSAFALLGSRFLLLHKPDSIRFASSVYASPSVTTMRADIGLPLLRLSSGNSTPFDPVQSWRLRLTVQGIARLVMENVSDVVPPGDAGMFLYPSDLCYGAPVQRALAKGRPTLYAVSKSGAVNPLLQQPMLHDGLGWQLASPAEAFIADPVLSLLDDLGRRFDVQPLDGDLLLQWSRATVSDLRMTPQSAMIAGLPVAVRGITRGALEFTADCLTKNLSFLINHPGRIPPVFRLHAPDNSVITAFDANDSTILLSQDASLAAMALTIVNPAPGSWRLELDGQIALPDRCILAVATDGTVGLDLRASRNSLLIGDTLVISAQLNGTASPAPDSVQFACSAVDSLGFGSAVQLRDDGIAPDTLAADGIFMGTFVPGTAGGHRIEGTLTANAGGCRIERKAGIAIGVRTGLELLSPLGGEEWKSGDTMQVRWRGDAPSLVDIDWSSDAGASWLPLATRHPAAGGSFDWIIPQVTSTRCLVRIADADGWRADTSDALFTIYQNPQITVLAPDGGEHWQVATVQEIRWQAIAVDDLSISYSINAGRDWLPVASNIDARAASWLWTIPVTPSDSCLLRLSNIDDPTVFGVSPAVFSITPIPAVTLLSPNGGERWREGSQRQIMWQSAAIDSVFIEYSTDDGATWSGIGTFDASLSTVSWLVPAGESDRCLVRVTAVGNPALTDRSNAVFSITPIPRLVLRSPIGGEFWEIASHESIRWESAGIERVDIDYSLDNGMHWRTVALNLPASLGSYVWSIPVEPSDIARVRVRDTYDTTLLSISPAVFSISESRTRPTLFAPANASDASSTRPNFIWRAFFGSVNYHLQVSTDNTFGSLNFERHDLTGTTFTSPELAVTTKYYWRVRARLASGFSEWSAVWSFTTGASIFGTPALLLPFDGALSMGVNVQFTWTASDSAATWHIQVSEFPNFSRLFAEEFGLTGRTHAFGNFAPDGDYFWRVRGGDQGSTAFGEWSAVSKFSTAPSSPRHLAPFNGLPDVPLSPILQWYPVIGARIYRVQVARNEAFTNIIRDTLLNGSSLQVLGLSSFTSYYWRMTVTTLRGTSLWSEPWLFRTLDIGTGVGAVPSIPVRPRILAVWPRPAGNSMHVSLDITQGTADLQLCDLLGRRVRTLSSVYSASGPVSTVINLNGLPSGSYILRLLTAGGADQMMVTVK